MACLLESGRRNLALIGWDGGEDESHPEDPAWAGLFRQALTEHGLTVEEKRGRTDIHPALPGAGWDQFRELWAAGKPHPDGLLVCDDFLFRDAATAILDMNVTVPDDLMVVTHANKGSGMFYPFPVDKFEVDPDQSAAVLLDLLREAKAWNISDPSHGFYLMETVRAAAGHPGEKTDIHYNS